jgi:ketol-acid reductoisomerase
MEHKLMRIVIIGFGNQAKAWALNLRDSNKEVHILARKFGPGWENCRKLGFPTLEWTKESLASFDTFILLTPDDTHTAIIENLKDKIKPGSKIIYAHGYSYVAGEHQKKFPQWSHLLLAPKAIASEVRFQYETKGKLGAVSSLEASLDPEKDQDLINDLAKSIGITSGPYFTNFKQETLADLFSEQTLLCSLLPYGALSSFNKLIEQGVSEELAYFECWYEVKLIADTMVQLGPKKFFDLISPNALLGGEKARKLIFNEDFEKKLDSLLEDIKNETFFTEVTKANFSEIRSEVINFWESQKLTEVHNKLAPELFGQRNQ